MALYGKYLCSIFAISRLSIVCYSLGLIQEITIYSPFVILRINEFKTVNFCLDNEKSSLPPLATSIP